MYFVCNGLYYNFSSFFSPFFFLRKSLYFYRSGWFCAPVLYYYFSLPFLSDSVLIVRRKRQRFIISL